MCAAACAAAPTAIACIAACFLGGCRLRAATAVAASTRCCGVTQWSASTVSKGRLVYVSDRFVGSALFGRGIVWRLLCASAAVAQHPAAAAKVTRLVSWCTLLSSPVYAHLGPPLCVQCDCSALKDLCMVAALLALLGYTFDWAVCCCCARHAMRAHASCNHPAIILAAHCCKCGITTTCMSGVWYVGAQRKRNFRTLSLH